ncbi:hypothetical protein C8Q74DRAFT_1228685 [Fomes fomentarius]|nr:hypothetical protein C8Q74DRAFT_1228685 [Fomes fomentarius]
MTGPPTPPPSSATEIQDAARTTAPPPQAALATEPAEAPTPAAPVPEQAQPAVASQTAQKTSYELLFPSIVDLARSGRVRDLIQVLEQADLSADHDKDSTRLLIVAPLVLAYLIEDEIPPARHVLTRLPDNLASIALTQGLFNLLASVSERKYADVYNRAERLRQFVSEPNFPNEIFGQLLAGLVTAFVEAFSKKTFNLLSRAYTSIPLPLAQVYLGLAAEQVVNVAVQAGWNFNETSHILTPSKQSAKLSRAQPSTPSTLYALNLVADTVANLET